MDILEHMLLDPSAKPTDLQLSLLEAITDNFSNACRIGRGGFSVVYMGRLPNGRAVAVKKLSDMHEMHENKFKQEVDSLMRVKHKNIVRFLGYCSDTQGKMVEFEGKNVMAEDRRRLLCFEFLQKGSLDKYITDASCGLEWHVRYDIIKGICSGLHYLHMECDIAHMDLKPHNILMDDNMVPKISDFGTSKLIDRDKSQIFTVNLLGTCGYMAPEYIDSGCVSKEADIFSFGIIILELLTGSRPYYHLSEESNKALSTDEVVGKWTKRLPNAAYSQQVSTCVLIARECVSSEKDKRPTTECIINKLIKVDSEIREKLISEGQESWSRVEMIKNVTIGVVALVLILWSHCSLWSCVVTIVVAGIILLCLQNPLRMILFGIGAILLTVLGLNPRTWSWVTVTLGVLTALPLLTILAMARDGLILIIIGVLLLTVLILNPITWSCVLLALKVLTVLVKTLDILVKTLDKVGIFLERPGPDLLALLAKVVTGAMARALILSLLSCRRSWMALLFSIVSILAAVHFLLNTSTSWSWAVVIWTTMKTVTPMNLLAILFVDICVPDDLRNSRPRVILFAIEAVQATVINQVNPIISLSQVATAQRVISFLVALLAIQIVSTVLLSILHKKSSRKQVILFAIMFILVIDSMTICLWRKVDIMNMVNIMNMRGPWSLGFMAIILLGGVAIILPEDLDAPSIPWTSKSASLLYPVVVALAADITIVSGIDVEIVVIFASVVYLPLLDIGFDIWEEQ